MEAMERRNSESIDTNDEGESFEEEKEEIANEVKVSRMLVKASNMPKVKVPMYEGNLNVEELMDWINALGKYFDFEEIENKNKVKYAAARIKGYATIWWDELQIHRERKGKSIIKTWDKMLDKIKSKFMPKDY